VQLQIATGHTEVSVSGQAVTVDTSQTLGNVISEKQATDLPLNGRDLTQLGLLQPGVAPMTAGLGEAGGIARSGQAYAVNGQRPESNNYLLDGASNVDSVNGGYALRTPVDAVNEFRILTLNAPAEYGDTSGATTSVVTKSGGNYLHGDVYDFFRNDAMDARNFFAAETEPLHRNQYGAPWADLSARTRISSSSTTKGSAIRRVRRRPLSCPPPRSGRETSPDSPTPPPGSPFPSSTSLPASRSRQPDCAVHAEPDRSTGGEAISATEYRHQRI